MTTIEELNHKEMQARQELKQAQEKADEAHKELDAAERKKKDDEQKAQYARDCAEAVKNTNLPLWVASFIQMEAYENGHSAGQSEVDMLTIGMIHRAEEYQNAKPT